MNKLIKVIFLFALALSIFLFKNSSAIASTIFEDTMKDDINTNFWNIVNNSYMPTPQGIQDNGSGNYTIFHIKNAYYTDNNEIKVDVTINNIVSGFSLQCRRDDNTGNIMGAFFGLTSGNPTGSILFRYYGENNYPFTWNDSPGAHKFDLVCNGSTATISEDGIQLQSHTFTTSFSGSYTHFDFGGTWAGIGGNSTFSNFTYCDSNSCNLSSLMLPVPLLKQTDPLWKNLTYDDAKIWDPDNYTIGRWGCALTSAAMILNYYNIHQIPDSTLSTTPGNLDAWLGIQPDGYIPNGNVNWLAISRLTKQAKANNPNFVFDALEYDRIYAADTTTLTADLKNNQPDILDESRHFVVATGQSGNTFTINDPYFNRMLLTDYNNTFASLIRYIPSYTNLSYMLFTADPSLTLTLKDSTNTPVGTSYVQQPLIGADTGLPAGKPITILSAKQPSAGSYTLTVSSSTDQIYTVTGYLYDTDGNVKKFTQTGIVDPNNPNTVSLSFNQQSLTADTEQKVVVPATFLSDLNNLYALKDVKQGAYDSLKSLGTNLQNDIQKHNLLLARVHLKVIKTLLEVHSKAHLLSPVAYHILLGDIEYIQAHLL